jgi:AraC-like DNA-binding protein
MHVDIRNQSTLLPACHEAWIPAGYRHRLRADLENITLRTTYFQAKENEPELLKEVHVFAVDPLGKDMIAYCERWADDNTTSPLETSLLNTIREFVPHWCAEPVSCEQPGYCRTAKKTITQIMHEVGYASPGSFTNSFQGLLGCTPSQYQSMARQAWGEPPAGVNLN